MNRTIRTLATGALALSTFGLLSACTAPIASLSSAGAPSECPRTGTFGHGTCTLPAGVLPAPASMHVDPGAPSQICSAVGNGIGPDGLPYGPDPIDFECPAGYTVP